ncbi:hypothetical protein BH24PSE2_BH24PSE2_02080 [soil metagenome]
MRGVLLILSVAGIAMAATAGAAENTRRSCSGGWICIEAIERDGLVDIVARNLKSWPVTVSLRARTTNLRPDGRNPSTRTIDAHERRRLMRLWPIDDTRSWGYRYVYDWTVGSLSPRHDETYLYRLPFGDSRRYRVLQGFDTGFTHNGLEKFTVDFDVPIGTPVHAAREGVVVRVEESNDRSCFGDGCGRHANYIVILHPDGTTGEYYHLDRNGALVEVGETVRRGQPIGLSGNTGNSTMPHLHFGVYRADDWGQTRSLPFRFVTTEGVVSRPRRGRRYGVG